MANVAVGNRYNIKTFQKAYPTAGTDSFKLVSSNAQIFLHSFLAYNANSLSTDLGLAIAMAPTAWKLYTANVNTGPGTDSTAAIQAGTATSIFTTVSNQGFLVESPKQFGYLTFTLSQAETGAPVYSYQYWNGSAWTTLNVSQTPVYTSTGVVHVTFNPPVDWATGDGGLGANTGYSVRVRATTAPTQAVKATSLRVGYWLCYRKGMAAGSQVAVSFDMHPLLLESGEALAPYFSTAYNYNAIEAAYQQAP